MKSSPYYLFWALGGTAVLAGLAVFVFHFQPESVSAQIEARAKRQEVVSQMRLHLASAVDAEKSAVLATDDQTSRTFADQARSETAAVEHLSGDFKPLLRTDKEKDLFAQFLEALSEFQRVDNELLDLAVRNSNLKAYALAFGPAADAVNDMQSSLSRLLANSASSPSPDARRVMALAADAETRVLRIETLFPPHIAEESDRKMDELERRMTEDDTRFRSDLAELEALLPANREVRATKALYGQFTEMKSQILELSHENTNVKSLSLSLSEMRKATALCQDTLTALGEAIEGEAIPGETVAIPR